MKTRRLLLRTAPFTLAVGAAACTRKSAQSAYWYDFKTADHGEVAATSPLDPEALAKALADTQVIRFENVREFNGAGQWYPEKPPFHGILFIRPQEMKSFEPMDGPPVDFNMQAAK